jgi:type 1 glutamine amidotransferase
VARAPEARKPGMLLLNHAPTTFRLDDWYCDRDGVDWCAAGVRHRRAGDAAGGESVTDIPNASAPSKRLLVVTHAQASATADPCRRYNAERNRQRVGTYDTEFCRTADDVNRLMTAEALARYNAVFFANTTGNLGIPDLAAFLSWISSGGGFVGAHSATDTYHESPEFLAMLGGEFQTHGKIAEADVRVDDPSHPTVAHLSPRFQLVDELYRFTKFNKSDVRMLLSLDRNPPDGVGEAGQPADLPMAWHKSHGRGRVFYTAFGHRDEVWQDPRFRQHLREAIRWAMN